MKKTNKLLSIILAILMIVTTIPMAFAADIIQSGECGADGDNLTWTLDSDGTLIISGTGDMKDYLQYDAPWYSVNLDKIKNVIVEYGVTSIGDNAFAELENLEKITLPDGITRIGSDAFANCNALTEIKIPDSVTTIAEGAFYYCGSLLEITIPDGVTRIEEGTFYYCNNLININLPENLEYIGNSAFGMCESLKEIIFPESVTVIDINAFYCCFGLTEITIPKNVMEIPLCAFIYCTGLTEVTIPDSVTKIGETAFGFCTALTEITIPDSVTTIDRGAFALCTGLTEVTIPNSVTTIGDMTFLDCTNLTTVNVPCTWDGTLYSFDDTVTLNPIVHKFTEYNQTKEPACGVAGEEIAECDYNCGTTGKREIPALDHEIIIDAAYVAPTCTQTGLTEGSHCTHCEDATVEQEVVSALGHINEDGDTICDRCGEIILCEDCGRPTHGDTIVDEFICWIVMLFNLIKSMF